jgi:hypothetical protein
MSTVAQVTDRVYREWLHPGDDQPVRMTLSAGVDDVATSWSYDDATLAPDEEDLLAPGVLVEVGTEQARITDVDDTANTLTVIRGVNGTTKAAHTSGDEVTVAPTFGRHAVVEAVKDNVVALYPSLWQVATEQVTTSSTFVEVPATVVTPVSFVWLNGSRYQNGVADLLPDFPPSSTGKAIQFFGVPSGKTGYFTYRGRFTRPSAEATELSTLGVDATWERIAAVGAAAQVVASRPLDELTAEYITEQMQREALPPGASTDVRNGLLTLRNIWLDEAHRSLQAEMQPPVVHNLAIR